MFNLDPGKLLVIAVVAIILLGPDRLPQVARQVGGAWRSFNEFRHRMESEVRNTMPDLPPTSEIARLARSPSALLNHLSNMSPPTRSPTGPSHPPARRPGTARPPRRTGTARSSPATTAGTGSAGTDQRGRGPGTWDPSDRSRRNRRRPRTERDGPVGPPSRRGRRPRRPDAELTAQRW